MAKVFCFRYQNLLFEVIPRSDRLHIQELPQLYCSLSHTVKVAAKKIIISKNKTGKYSHLLLVFVILFVGSANSSQAIII